MPTKVVLLTVVTNLIAVFPPAPSRVLAQQSSADLRGQVSSQEEGAMEGVVVSANKDASTITVSVVSDKQGHFTFPANRLEPGRYSLAIRAVGYDLDGPATADVTAHKTAAIDLKLVRTKHLASQLTSAEWLMSMTGTDLQKEPLLNCVNCHTLERPLSSTHTSDEFTQVILRMMGYASGSQPIRPQRRVNADEVAGDPEKYRGLANYLAGVNRSAVSTWQYPLKTLPRPSGRSTHVIVTEYRLPRPTIMPHDVMLDEHGTVWYSDFGEQYFGKLDPKTGKVTEWPVPSPKPGYPEGMLDLEEDTEGQFWLGMMFQGAVARFDPKTEKFQVYSAPAELNDQSFQVNMLAQHFAVDGKVWTSGRSDEIYRVDVNTGKWEKFLPLKQLPGPRPSGIYGLTSDSHNNLYFAEIGDSHIGRIDAKTGEVKFYATPTRRSRPRRIRADSQDRLWFGEYQGNRIGLFDPKTEQFTEWRMPTPWSGPYDVACDKNGELWTGGMTTDRVVRLNPKTGEVVEYLLPKSTNIRNVFVDNSTTPVTFWTGSNHGGAILKVQPLD
ncbi:MAG: carboxypeptidase regulatory-like domain-containing protein [Candidatus Acidiferrales bacterium]|jgi:streptogramin lyase